MLTFGSKENCFIEIYLQPIHPSLNVLQQHWTQLSIKNNVPVIESVYALFEAGSEEEISISGYSKEVKSRVSNVVFAIKKIYFELYEPEYIVHDIKYPANMAKIEEVYRRKLSLPNYEIVIDGNVLSYIRNDIKSTFV